MKTWVKLYTEIIRDPDIGELLLTPRTGYATMIGSSGENYSGAAFFIRQGSTISYCRQKAAFEFRNSVGEGCAGSPQNTGTRRRLFAFNGV
jgi:hypothetical protein